MNTEQVNFTLDSLARKWRWSQRM